MGLSCRNLLALDDMHVLLCQHGKGGAVSAWVRGEGLQDGELGLGVDKDGDPAVLPDLPPDATAWGSGNTVAVHSAATGEVRSFGVAAWGKTVNEIGIEW
eukprot:gene33261-5670_t